MVAQANPTFTYLDQNQRRSVIRSLVESSGVLDALNSLALDQIHDRYNRLAIIQIEEHDHDRRDRMSCELAVEIRWWKDLPDFLVAQTKEQGRG
jgi:hypothetical protein